MKEITINTLTLSGDINELRSMLSDVRGQLKGMFEQVAELDAMWDGPANEAFNRQFNNDYENAVNLCTTVESLLNCMEYARDQYNQCENGVGSIVNAIPV